MSAEMKKDKSSDKLTFGKLVQKVSQMWKVADSETLDKFKALAKVDYDRYQREMTAYRERPDVQSALAQSASKGRVRKFVDVAKRPLSGYNIFFQQVHQRHSSIVCCCDTLHCAP